jgi:hypothetical protein
MCGGWQNPPVTEAAGKSPSGVGKIRQLVDGIKIQEIRKYSQSTLTYAPVYFISLVFTHEYNRGQKNIALLSLYDTAVVLSCPHCGSPDPISAPFPTKRQSFLTGRISQPRFVSKYGKSLARNPGSFELDQLIAISFSLLIRPQRNL